MNIIEDKAKVSDAIDEVLEESKADCFRRLAIKRTTVAVDKIRLIGNLSNRANYEYTEEQAQKIITALEDAVRDVENQLYHVKKQKSTFSL